MQWNVGTKIATGFGLVIVIFVIVGGLSYQSATRQAEDARWVSHTHEVVATLAELLTNITAAETGQRGFIITGDESYLAPYTAGIAAAENTRKRLAELIEDNVKQTSRLDALTPMLNERITTLQDAVEARRRANFDAAQQIVATGRGKIAMDNIRQLIREMRVEEEELVNQRAALAAVARKQVQGVILWGTGLALLAAAIIGIVLTRNIAGPLGGLTTIVERISTGDLSGDVAVPSNRVDEVGVLARAFHKMNLSLRTMATTAEQIASGDLRTTMQPLSQSDTLGTAFARMTNNLRSQITSMAEGAAVLGSAASEIVASTAQLASGASESAAAVSQTTITVEEIRQTAQMATQKSRAVADNAQKAVQVSHTGRKSTEDAAAGMTRIRAQMDAIAESMMRLSEQSQTIGQIITTVEDLAAQSNLLAVNAAIEAAKAGEHGKGFGVVAQEVKSLAEQSRQATDRVRVILNDIQKATTAAVMATEQGAKAVEAGARQTETADESIQGLMGSVTEAAQAATQIAASSQQQLVGMDQVAGAMENIKQASAQNVASARQLEVSARNLNDLGMRLKKLVENYAV